MPNWKKVIVSGSDASLNKLTVTNGITGSLLGTASTASYVNTLNQSVIITGSLAVGTSSLGASENTITLGARDNASEGGQIGFNAPGGTYASASFIDNWQNKARILKGNNTTSTGLIAQWDIHTTQMQLAGYTAASSFPGTATANLAVDSGGNVITVSTTGGSVFPYVGNAVITGSLTTTGIIYAQPNGGMYFQGGDDAALYDINVSNHMGIYGVQDSTVGSIKLGSGGGIISGKSNSIGIGTINPTSASFQVNGNVWANSFTGSLLGTASYATQALSASYAANGGVTQLLAGPNITLSPTNGLGQVTVSATLSGSTTFNTATGSYGSFYDTTTQTNPVGDVPRSMSFNTTDITNGVSISGSTSPFNTYIKTQNAGIYNIQFSAQVDKTDGGTDDIVIWLRKNGIDLTDSATTLTLPTNNSKVAAAWNWFVTSATGDYYQIIWRSLDTDLRLLAEPISGTHPGIPSVILTVNRVDQFLSNTGSFSGSFTGILTGTASYASQALSSSFASTASYVLNAISASYAATSSTTTAISGTINYIPRFVSSSILGNSNIIQSASNIGIGITPQSGFLFDVNGQSVIRGAVYVNGPLIEFGSTAYKLNNAGFSWVSSGSGNFGVGTVIDSGYKLDVSGTSRFTGVVTVDSNAGYLTVGGSTLSAPLVLLGQNAFVNGIAFQQAGGDNRAIMRGFSASTQTMNLDPAGAFSYFNIGNIAIGGTTDAGYKLDVQGTGRFTNGVSMTGSIALSGSISINNGTDLMKISRGSGALGRLVFSRPGNEAVESVSFGGGNSEIYIRSGAGQILHDGIEFQLINSTGTKGLGLFASTGDVNLYGNSSTNGLRLFGATRNVLIQNGGTFVDSGYRLDVSGSARIKGYANTSISSSLVVLGSGSSQPIFTVQGSQGELFSVTDSLSGSLFSVNDISGLPILEAFSDNTVLLGSYQAPALLTTNKVVLTASGNFTLSTLPTSSYDGAFYDYTARSGSNARAGSIMAIWGNGGTVNFTETTTTDFGNTAGLNLGVFVSGANMILTGSASTTAWTIKTIIRSI